MERSGWNMVLLRHHVPDGTWHFDWMLDLGEAPTGSGLTTFRVWERPDDVPIGAAIQAEPLKDHRREYLTFEGDISGARGRVERVATGRARLISDGGGRLEFEAAFDGGPSGRWSVLRWPAGPDGVKLMRFA